MIYKEFIRFILLWYTSAMNTLGLRRGDPCTFTGCSNKILSNGLCSGHMSQKNRGLELRPIRKPVKKGEWGAWNKAGGYVVRRRMKEDGTYEYQSQHRAVMEHAIGRPLLPTETVHHINGVRDDNRPENLELWSSAQPSGQRVPDKVDYALEILRTYRPELLA